MYKKWIAILNKVGKITLIKWEEISRKCILCAFTFWIEEQNYFTWNLLAMIFNGHSAGDIHSWREEAHKIKKSDWQEQKYQGAENQLWKHMSR